MNRSDREGIRRERVGASTCFDAWGAVNHYGFDVLLRGPFGIAGSHESVMHHLRERVTLPTEAPDAPR